MAKSGMAKPKRLKSDSRVQREAQKDLLEWLSLDLKLQLKADHCPLDEGGAKVDAYYEDETRIILAEIWAHVGPAKSAQRHKVLSDILKLVFLMQKLKDQFPRKQIDIFYVFADQQAAEVLAAGRWAKEAIRHFEVRAKIGMIPPDVRKAIKEAQKQQDIRDFE